MGNIETLKRRIEGMFRDGRKEQDVLFYFAVLSPGKLYQNEIDIHEMWLKYVNDIRKKKLLQIEQRNKK